MLFNPVGDNDYDTVRTLVVAFQMIKPGEYARPHRFPNAMRLILDAGPGCYTVVDGVSCRCETRRLSADLRRLLAQLSNEGDANAH